MIAVKIALLLVFNFICNILVVSALPQQITVNQRATECLYDKVEKDDYITMSIFILQGSELRATAIMEGPVAPSTANTGKELQESIKKFDSGHRFGKYVNVNELVDFEHMQDNNRVDDDDDIPAKDLYIEDDDDDDDDNVEAGGEISEARKERRKKRAERRQKAREARRKREQKRMERMKKRQTTQKDEGQPFQKTIKVDSPGWYRVCVRGAWYQIVAEIEMRKKSELGGINDFKGGNGHVWTWEERMQYDSEEKLMSDKAKDEEPSIKDEDFEYTRNQLKKLRKLLSEIQTSQIREQHRLTIHSQTNEHSHSRMVLSSLLETVLFMIVTGFQIYTIRKWFKGAPVLGR